MSRQPGSQAPGRQVVFGKHAVRALLRARPQSVKRVVLLEGARRYLGEFAELARGAHVRPEYLSRPAFVRAGRLAEDDKHQGVFVVADPPPVHGESDLRLLRHATLVLVLDQVSNPQNFGTMLRNAAFFGADAVIWMKDRAVDVSPTVLHIAVGGAELVDLFRVTNLARSLDALKEVGFWVYGLDERGQLTLAETEFAAQTALVVGAEGEGLRHRTKQHCDQLVRIPGGRPGLESLNAGVATAVALAEVTRTGDRFETGTRSAEPDATR